MVLAMVVLRLDLGYPKQQDDGQKQEPLRRSTDPSKPADLLTVHSNVFILIRNLSGREVALPDP